MTLSDDHSRRRPKRCTFVSLVPLAFLLALLGTVEAVQPTFLSAYTLGVLADESSVILLLATGQTAVILLGGIDLSMAALAALSSVLIAITLPTLQFGGVLSVLALTTFIGACQGYIHTRARIPSVVVTLAGQGIWSSIALAIAHTTIPVTAGYSAVAWLKGDSLGVPNSFALAAVALAFPAASLRWLSFGRHTYSIGLNPRAALLSGIRVSRVKMLAFAIAGLFSGLAGMALVARTYSGNPTIADSLLLPSIAAVLIGGTEMRGGVGGLGPTLIGVLSVTVLRVGIAATGLDPAYEPIAYGVLIVAAVGLRNANKVCRWNS